MEEETEIDFRLDSEGRTQPRLLQSAPRNGDGKSGGRDDDEQSTIDEGVALESLTLLDYNPKSAQGRFVLLADDAVAGDTAPKGNDDSTTEEKILDDLLFDCEISDCGLMPRTFWVPATGFRPRFR